MQATSLFFQRLYTFVLFASPTCAHPLSVGCVADMRVDLVASKSGGYLGRLRAVGADGRAQPVVQRQGVLSTLYR